MRRDPDQIVLEVLVHHELAGLRPPEAPPTLLPRIMSAVQAWASRPWYQRAWFTWPAVWQAVALILFSSFAAAVILGVGAVQPWLTGAVDVAVKEFSPTASRLLTAMVALSSVARALLEPAIVYRAYAFPIVVAVCAACLALAAALQRIAMERTSSS